MKKILSIILPLLIISCNEVSPYKEGLAVVKNNKGDYYYYIDESGNKVIDNGFSYAKDFENGFAIARIDGKAGVINKKGKTIIPFKYTNISQTENGYFIVKEINYSENINLAGLVNQNNKDIIPLVAEDIKILSNNIFLAKKIETENDWFVFDDKGIKYKDKNNQDILVSANSTYTNGYIFSDNCTYDLKNKDSKINLCNQRISIAYDSNVRSNILFKFRSEIDLFKVGLLDYKGDLLIPLNIVKYIDDFSDNFASVSYEGKYGYINNKGIFTIKPIFDDAKPFTDGKALVNLNGKRFYINKLGKCVENCPSNEWLDYYKLESKFSTDKKISSVYIDKGLVASNNKNYKESIDLFSVAILNNPLSYDAYLNRSLSYYFEKNYDEALDDIEKAIRISPYNPNAYYIKGNILSEKKYVGIDDKYHHFYDKAEKALLKAILLDKNNLDYYEKLIFVLGKSNQKKEACYYMKKGCDAGNYTLCDGFYRFCNDVYLSEDLNFARKLVEKSSLKDIEYDIYR